MYYVCIEQGEIKSVLNYAPNVPKTVELVEISDSDYDKIIKNTHFFDISSKKIVSVSQEVLDQKQLEQSNIEYKEFLNATDWMVLRHIRQKALGQRTTLSETEYLDLETQRDKAARLIR
jgi:hypothetical protein